MTTGKRNRSVRSSRGRRRRGIWEVFLSDPTSIAAGGTGVTDLTQNFRNVAGSAERAGVTAVRIRGDLIIRPENAGVDVEWAAGIAMTNEDASIAAALPDPTGDFGFPWMWRGGGVMFDASIFNRVVDLASKAMRRFRSDDDRIEFIIDNDDPSHALTYALRGAMYFLLP